MIKHFIGIFIGFIGFTVFYSTNVFAKLEGKQQLAEVWVIDIPFQQSQELQKVLRSYITQRKKAGDYAEWQIYRSELNSHLDSYLIHHCCFNKSERGRFEKWMNENNFQKSWQLSDNLTIEDFEYFFWPSDKTIEIDRTKESIAVSQFNLHHGAPVRNSISQIKINASDMFWGESWAWTNEGEGNGKGLLNVNFSYDPIALEETGVTSFDLEQKIIDLQFDINLEISQSRYLVYNLID